MTLLEILRGARELISDKRRWTQGSYARNAIGDRTSIQDASSVRWCASGAIWKTGGITDDSFHALQAMTNARQDLFPSHLFIAKVNDDLGYDAVMMLFDEAIRRAEIEERAKQEEEMLTLA